MFIVLRDYVVRIPYSIWIFWSTFCVERMMSISGHWSKDYTVRELNFAVGNFKGSEEEGLGAGTGDSHP